MLLSIEVSLYSPRFVVMEVMNERLKIVHTAVNDHAREASMTQHNRTPVGTLLMEIADTIEFLLTAFPVTNAVWHMRQQGVANLNAARTALGAILLTLSQHGIKADEMLRSRAQLLLTGTSKPDAQRTREAVSHFTPDVPDQYALAAFVGAAWCCGQQLIDNTHKKEG